MVRCSRGINVAGVRAVPAAEWLRAEVMQVRFVELLATVFDFTSRRRLGPDLHF
jgi:hypothetical protein